MKIAEAEEEERKRGEIAAAKQVMTTVHCVETELSVTCM